MLEALTAKRSRDARWQDGRTFGMVYDGGPEVHAVAEAVAQMFLHENALNVAAFPSLAEIQSEVVGACAELFHAPDGAAGFMTSGGTESILSAVKAAARTRARRAQHHRAGDGGRRERARRVPQSRALLRRHAAQGRRA